MRIAVVSDRDGLGGDARIAAGLANGYRRNGHQVLFLVGQRRTGEPGAVEPRAAILSRLAGQIPPLDSSSAFRRYVLSSGTVRSLAQFQPDVVHLHNIHQQLGGTASLLARIAARFPVVWTLHDMWAITGGCAHSFGCKKYLAGCADPCPRRGVGPLTHPVDIASEWREKRAAFRRFGSRTILACPSQWLADLAREAVGDRVRVERVSNGIDTNVFRRVPQTAARAVLGLPQERHVIMFGTLNLRDKEKGGELLAAAIQTLPEPRPFFLSVGNNPQPYRRDDGAALGHVKDDRFLAICYSAADLFALPSLAENQPLVLLEAMACGTPCVSFAVGGCGEMIRDGVTGFLAPAGEVQGLVGALRKFLSLPTAAVDQMRQACLDSSHAYPMEPHVTRYLELLAEAANTKRTADDHR